MDKRLYTGVRSPAAVVAARPDIAARNVAPPPRAGTTGKCVAQPLRRGNPNIQPLEGDAMRCPSLLACLRRRRDDTLCCAPDFDFGVLFVTIMPRHTFGLQRQSPAPWRTRPVSAPQPAYLRRADSCKTNPISAGQVDQPGADCAKRTQFAAGRSGAIVRNKANFGRGQEMASAWWRKSYGGLATRTAPAKQSQFPPGPGAHGCQPAGWWCKQSQFRRAVIRAKQSQFRSTGRLAPRADRTNKANSRRWPIAQNEPNFRRMNGRVQWRYEYQRRRL